MEAALISNNVLEISDTLKIRGCVYFNKYLSVRRDEFLSVSLSEKQYKFIVGKFAENVRESDANASNVHAFSDKKKVAFVKGVVSLHDKEKTISLSADEFKELCDRRQEVEEIFNKFLIYSPVAPNALEMDNATGQQNAPLVNALAQVAPAGNNGAQIVNAIHLGPPFTFVYGRLVEAQGVANPSCRRRLANRMCDDELHTLLLAALLKNEFTDEARKRACHGCQIDHGSQKEHMNPGCLDPETEVVTQWLSRAGNMTFFKNNIAILARHLKAPIPDRSSEVCATSVVKVVKGETDYFCAPCCMTLPLYQELLESLGL